MRKTAGFTIVELLVAITIFGVVLMLIISVFMVAQRTQRMAGALQRLQTDGRFITTKIANDFQNSGALDYKYYEENNDFKMANGNVFLSASPPNGSIPILAIKAADGTTHLYKNKACDFTVSDTIGSGIPQCLYIQELKSDGSYGAEERLSSTGMTIPNLGFYISPKTDPFLLSEEGEYPVGTHQPRVTTVFKEEANVRGVKTPLSINLQTTLSSREYKR